MKPTLSADLSTLASGRAVRSFVAINLSDGLKAAVAQLIERLRATGADVKWVNAAGMHMTLKFLGAVADEKLPEVFRAAREATAGTGGFTLSLRGLGGFPSLSAPRVVWVGVHKGGRELAIIAERVEAAFERIGFVREQRAFSPHATLGRVRSPRGREKLAEEIRAGAGLDLGEMRVERAAVMESRLQPTGAVYRPLEEIDL